MQNASLRSVTIRGNVNSPTPEANAESAGGEGGYRGEEENRGEGGALLVRDSNLALLDVTFAENSAGKKHFFSILFFTAVSLMLNDRCELVMNTLELISLGEMIRLAFTQVPDS